MPLCRAATTTVQLHRAPRVWGQQMTFLGPQGWLGECSAKVFTLFSLVNGTAIGPISAHSTEKGALETAFAQGPKNARASPATVTRIFLVTQHGIIIIGWRSRATATAKLWNQWIGKIQATMHLQWSSCRKYMHTSTHTQVRLVQNSRSKQTNTHLYHSTHK